ncbi:MAG: hypothetical protein RQ756_01585 [Flavobacteriaceae bacterium]|nr:hypothetical protein [Flavobacteriaceae bacterium]
MLKNIYLYLFIFSILIAVFVLVNGNRSIAILESKLNKSEARAELLRDSVERLQDSLAVMAIENQQKFSLKYNEDARYYFEMQNIEPDEVEASLVDALIATNRLVYEGGEHPLIPFKGNLKPFVFNSFHVLNNRWVIADFTDTKTWGEVFIKYYLDDEGRPVFEQLDAVIFPSY